MKPLCIDLFCGLGGWAEGFLPESYEVIGFDTERHDYGTGGYPGQLVLQDVLTLHGSQFRNATVIVASPPCQAYSYRAMPWSRAKALPPPDNTLFEACFRIQGEACEAAGRHIPLIVENVRGAQKWVGRAAWHFGSYFLWGDVPALMPIGMGRKNTGGSWFGVAHNTGSGKKNNPVEKHLRQDPRDAIKVPGFRFDGSGKSFQSESVKVAGMNWSNHGKPGYKPKGFNVTAAQNYRAENGTKQGGDWFGKGEDQSMSRRFGSKSNSRKAASAMIAKIPFPLANHIARSFV